MSMSFLSRLLRSSSKVVDFEPLVAGQTRAQWLAGQVPDALQKVSTFSRQLYQPDSLNRALNKMRSTISQNIAVYQERQKRISVLKPTCLVPRFSGVSLTEIEETNLWEVYCMAMPRPRLESEKKYKNLKRASQR
jgi:hypothetical protein